MRKVNGSWMAVVAAALLLGTLVGVVWARPNDRPTAATTTRKVTLTGADFIPTSNADHYLSEGYRVYCQGAPCQLFAPVLFPTNSSVTVERIKLHVDDANTLYFATAALRRAHPSAGGSYQLGTVDSPQDTSGGVKTYTSDAINKVVWPSQKAFIALLIDSDITVYGVTVEYHVNS